MTGWKAVREWSRPAARWWRRTRPRASSGACPARSPWPGCAARCCRSTRSVPSSASCGAGGTMTGDDFDLLCRLLKERSGLVLTRDKAYLLESRLLPVARKRNMKALDELIAALRGRPDGELAARRGRGDDHQRNASSSATSSRSTSSRSFVLPQLLKSRAQRKSIRIWSAACSSGQEAYSLAMMLTEEKAKMAGLDDRDRRHRPLDRDPGQGAGGDLFAVRGAARPAHPAPGQVFQAAGRALADRSAPSAAPSVPLPQPARRSSRRWAQFDVVFCRNVLIYFDQPTKTTVLERMSRMLPPDGFLYLGGAETVIGIIGQVPVARRAARHLHAGDLALRHGAEARGRRLSGRPRRAQASRAARRVAASSVLR